MFVYQRVVHPDHAFNVNLRSLLCNSQAITVTVAGWSSGACFASCILLSSIGVFQSSLREGVFK